MTQHYLACLSHTSYLVGDETTGRAVVVDPRRDVGIYLQEGPGAYCASGYRSMVAAGWLAAAGFQDVSDLLGGYRAWQGAGLLVAHGADRGSRIPEGRRGRTTRSARVNDEQFVVLGSMGPAGAGHC